MIDADTPDLTRADASSELENGTPAFNAIGVELEYPVASDETEVPVSEPHTSNRLNDQYNGSYHGGDEVPAGDAPNGIMTSDHVGAEIVSDVLDIHTTEPEVWYTETIKTAEADGHPFAANGRGETSFGLHMHISSLDNDQRDFLYEMACEPWMRLFVCSSMSDSSADPWRHGGVTSRHFGPGPNGGQNSMLNDYSGRGQAADNSGHYEWRLPEPMLPSNFAMVMHFLRLISLGEFEEARSYGKGRVEEADRRLTSVQQFMALDSPEWRERAVRDGSYTDPEMAEYTIEMYGE